jgi:hypothetical protein
VRLGQKQTPLLMQLQSCRGVLMPAKRDYANVTFSYPSLYLRRSSLTISNWFRLELMAPSGQTFEQV